MFLTALQYQMTRHRVQRLSPVTGAGDVHAEQYSSKFRVDSTWTCGFKAISVAPGRKQDRQRVAHQINSAGDHKPADRASIAQIPRPSVEEIRISRFGGKAAYNGSDCSSSALFTSSVEISDAFLELCPSADVAAILPETKDFDSLLCRSERKLENDDIEMVRRALIYRRPF